MISMINLEIVTDALEFAFNASESKWVDQKITPAIAICEAALAEQSEPVARVMYDDDGIKTNNLIDCDLPVGTLLFTHPAPSEADELLLNLGLNPVQYRTEGGAINHLKVKAAILHPQDYPQYVKGALVIPGYESGPMVEDKP